MFENQSLVKYASFVASSSGDNVIVAGVSNRKIRVLSFAGHGSGSAVNAYLHDETPTNRYGSSANPVPIDKTGVAGGSVFGLGFNEGGWFECDTGKGLVLNLSASNAVVGVVTYMLS